MDKEYRINMVCGDFGLILRSEEEPIDFGEKYKRRVGLFECICGNMFKTTFKSVRNGNTKSCGCRKKTS